MGIMNLEEYKKILSEQIKLWPKNFYNKTIVLLVDFWIKIKNKNDFYFIYNSKIKNVQQILL